MAKTVSKTIGEGFGRGEIYAALAYDSSDKFGGYEVKNMMTNTNYKHYFRDTSQYIYSSATATLDIVATRVNIAGLNFTEGTASSIDPSTTAESGWINVKVGGVLKGIPYYNLS